MNLLEQNLNVLWASLIIQEFIKLGLRHFYVSPGNRNAPFLAALEKCKNTDVHVHLCVDERGAAYRALGYSRGNSLPGVLICTSGTALANYFPAVIEAKKENLPMVILSADRPFELQNSDANQSISQENFFGTYVQACLNLPTPSEQVSPRVLLTKLDYLLMEVFKSNSGPLHINCPFGDPLVPKHLPYTPSYLEEARRCSDSPIPQTMHLHNPPDDTTEMPLRLQSLLREISEHTRGMIVVGGLKYSVNELEDLAQELHSVHRQLGMPIFLDVNSGLRGFFPPSDLLITSIEQASTWELLKSYQVDMLFHLGGRITAQKYYSTFLANSMLKEYVLLSSTPEHQDPLGLVSLRWHTSVKAGLSQIKNLLHDDFLTPVSASTQKLIQDLAQQKKQIEKKLSQLPWCFATLAKALGQSILKYQQDYLDEEGFLFIGNSLSIRVMDELSPEDFPALPVYANRGVSGIEGQVATALGLIDSLQRFGVCLLGDVGLIHDLNSLLFLREFTQTPLCIVVVNNGGGRIFERLPMREYPEVLTPYMTTPHELNFEGLCTFTGLKYRQIKSSAELEHAMAWALSLKAPVLLEAIIDPVLDLKAYDELQKK